MELLCIQANPRQTRATRLGMAGTSSGRSSPKGILTMKNLILAPYVSVCAYAHATRGQPQTKQRTPRLIPPMEPPEARVGPMGEPPTTRSVAAPRNGAHLQFNSHLWSEAARGEEPFRASPGWLCLSWRTSPQPRVINSSRRPSKSNLLQGLTRVLPGEPEPCPPAFYALVVLQRVGLVPERIRVGPADLQGADFNGTAPDCKHFVGCQHEF